MSLDKLLAEDKAVEANTIADGTTSWKDRIISYMANRPEAAATKIEILKNTDPKYTGENLSSRSHCLASQLTYLRQDMNVVTKQLEDNRIVLLGVRRKDKVIPFKNAVKYL